MAAPLGFKTFTVGEVLSAADVNGYLMQGVLVFATTAARDAAITSPQEGQFAFTKDTNSLFYYDGAAWVASGATGDIEGVTAGTGISGGGTSGTVTVTNSMATAIDAKGDLIVGTGADAFSRLAVGANDLRVVAASGEATGLKYVADTQNTVIDAEGDLLVGDAADTIQRLALGSNAQVLTVDTTVDGKIKWATPSGGSSTFVGCSVYESSSQAITNATYTYRNFDLELFDTDGFHSNSVNNSRITIPSGKAGYYLVAFAQPLGTNATGDRIFHIQKNGTLVSEHAGTPSAVYPVLEGKQVLNLAVADYLELRVYQASGTTLNYSTTATGGYFSVAFLGA